jgi:hypothetical protein
MAKAFARFDPERYEHPNVPAWIVFDAAYRRKYMVITAPPGGKDPPWLVSAGTLGDLAAKVGIDGAGLAATVERFNGFAAAGVDEDFGRGASLYDRFYGDPDVHPNPNLGAIAEPPFFALPVHPGAIGTKGGPRIDAHARVLGTDGEPIAGLYAAGNAAASPMGSGYPGAGSTIGLALTFGWLAGRHAAGRPFSDP